MELMLKLESELQDWDIQLGDVTYFKNAEEESINDVVEEKANLLISKYKQRPISLSPIEQAEAIQDKLNEKILEKHGLDLLVESNEREISALKRAGQRTFQQALSAVGKLRRKGCYNETKMADRLVFYDEFGRDNG